MLFLFFQKVDPEVVFTKQERIGKGSFGEVFKGIDNRTQQVNKHFWGGMSWPKTGATNYNAQLGLLD